MGQIHLLDCTLRDGGYLNDWNFGHSVLNETAQRLANAGIDYIELGFLDDRRKEDINRSIFPRTECINKIYHHLDKKQSKLLAMIDYGTCDISNIQPQQETIIDGIRVIFKKEKMDGAIAFCSQIKALGYEVFAQLVSTTVYEEDDFNHIARLANELMPTALSIVDTYGLMDEEELARIYQELDSRIDKKVILGFHAHNNLQLGFSNAISFLTNRLKTDRVLVADGTLHGMGKGAGNAPIESLAFYANKYVNGHYDINQLLEAIDSNILKLFGKNNWGYSMKFFLAATNRVHPNYLSDYISSGVLSISDINNILKNINEPKKLYYDKNESARVFDDFKLATQHLTDASIKALDQEIKGRKVLLLGPGDTIVGERKAIDKYIKKEAPVIIAVNYLPHDYEIDYLFITNSRRLCDIASKDLSSSTKIISTSNLSPINKEFSFIVDYAMLTDNSAAKDSAIVMALRLLCLTSISTVALAGFDGYKSSFEESFVNISNSYGWKEPYPGFLNSYIRNEIKQLSNKLDISFLTTSMLEDED